MAVSNDYWPETDRQLDGASWRSGERSEGSADFAKLGSNRPFASELHHASLRFLFDVADTTLGARHAFQPLFARSTTEMLAWLSFLVSVTPAGPFVRTVGRPESSAYSERLPKARRKYKEHNA